MFIQTEGGEASNFKGSADFVFGLEGILVVRRHLESSLKIMRRPFLTLQKRVDYIRDS